MNFVPNINTEYLLLRPFHDNVHIITYIRYSDDSGCVKHGNSLHGWEFNPTAWSEDWKRLQSAGWQTLDDAIKTRLTDSNALPDCTHCNCQIPDISKFLDERTRLSVPLDQINREWREYAKLFDELEQALLWGG